MDTKGYSSTIWEQHPGLANISIAEIKGIMTHNNYTFYHFVINKFNIYSRKGNMQILIWVNNLLEKMIKTQRR